MTDGSFIPQVVIPQATRDTGGVAEHTLPRPDVEVQLSDPYVNQLRERAWQLAPILWKLARNWNGETWEQAYQDRRRWPDMRKCHRTAEMCLRMVDLVTDQQLIAPDPWEK